MFRRALLATRGVPSKSLTLFWGGHSIPLKVRSNPQ